MKYDWTRVDAGGRIAAVLIACPLLYAAFNIFCIFVLPAAPELSLAIAVVGGFPISTAAMCYAMLARTSRRAWTVLLTITLLLGGYPLLTALLS